MDVVFTEPHTRVTRYLATVRQQVQTNDETALVIARAELPGIVDAFEKLLAGHRPDDDGRCRACGGWLRRKAPCRVFIAAQIALFQHAHGKHALA